jgi:O-antigen/teichoic acid export membrane protein
VSQGSRKVFVAAGLEGLERPSSRCQTGPVTSATPLQEGSRSGGAGGSAQGGGRPQTLVLRNAGWLVAAQVAAAPLSIAVNAILGRRLGALEFGQLYLALTVCSLAFLVVEWGQGAALAGLVARFHERAGLLLGSSLAWRAAAGFAAALLLVAGAAASGWSPRLVGVMGLAALAGGLGVLARACLDAVRGYERTDVAALGLVGQQLLAAALVVPALLLGFGLLGVAAAQALAAGILLLASVAVLRPLGFPRPRVAAPAVAELVRAGSPFLLLGLAITAQPNVDALLLARLAPAEVMGWHAAALKLMGALVFPASSLISALYPTLFRLHAADPGAFLATARTALRTAAVLVLPLAVGCGLFPDVGVAIFGRGGYGPSEDNLRVLAAYLLLVYFSMTLGCAVSAAGRQRAWALCQVGCVGLGAVLDAVLIPVFQRRTGNGGLGVCTSLVICEVAMLGCALRLSPRGLFDRALLRALAATGLAGLAMVLPAWLLASRGPLLAVPAAGAAYLAALVATGGLDRAQVQRAVAILLRRAPGAA